MKVLLVEDNELDAFVSEKVLVQLCSFVEIIKTACGQSALDAATTASEPFDIVFLDQHLAGQNGVDLIQPLQRIPSTCNCPVIMLTCDASDGVKAASLAHDASAFIVKPLEANVLSSMLATKNFHWRLQDLPKNLDGYRDIRRGLLPI